MNLILRVIETALALAVTAWLFLESYTACAIFVAAFFIGATLAGTIGRNTPLPANAEPMAAERWGAV